MYKRKSFFVTFEGIEGSGKTYLSKKLFKKIKSMRLPAIYTREPGGTGPAEKIRKVILDDYFHPDSKEKFNKYTDTLLYLAARNEHIEKRLKPAISKKKIIICDRFIDSTLAYQVYGKGVNKGLVDSVHKYILGSIQPDLTFILKANISKAMQRLKKRKKKIIKAVIEYNSPIQAPIAKGDKIGTLNVYVAGELEKEIDVLSGEDIKRANIFSRLLKSFNFLVWGNV